MAKSGERIMNKYLPFVIGIVSLAAGGQVYAAVCSPDTTGGLIDTGDVTFAVSGSTAADSDACDGLIAGNDSTGTDLSLGGANFDFQPKDETIGTPSTVSGSWMGIDFTLDGFMATTSGSYTLTWMENSSGALPKTVDIAVVLKGSPGYASYLFEAETLTATNSPGSGEWTINFLNPGGNIPDLSHLSVYFRSGDTPPNGMPEPGTLGMLMLGFIGAGVARRRKTKHTA
jgi:hypothetical protein